MRCALGTTRFVLLVGDKAIKIGRARPIALFFRVLMLPFFKKGREKFYRKYHSNFWIACRRYLVWGLIANRAEFSYYQTHKEELVAPVTAKFLGGWILIQDRGEKVSHSELLNHESFGVFNPPVTHRDSKQFCRFPDGRILLVDYADN